MDRLASKKTNIIRRKHRVRTVVRGDNKRPRLSVNVSANHVSAQLIDDSAQKSIASASSMGIKAKGSLIEKSTAVGSEIAEKAKAKKIKKVAFDRGSRKYHGRVKALAEAARKGGLEF